MRRFGVGTVALAAAFVVVAAGCGQSGAPGAEGSDQLEIRTVASSTEAAGTAKFEGSFQSFGGSGSPEGHFEGEVDFDNDRSVSRTRYEGIGDLGPQESESFSVDGWVYSEAPRDGSEGVAGIGSKPWYRMRMPSTGMGMFPIGTSVDVTGYLGLLESMGARTEVVGSETVRGTETTRYRITEGDSSKIPAQVEALGRFTSSDDKEKATFELWADGAGRLRRLRTESSDGKPGSDGGSRYEFEMFDYGEPVTIEPPPLDQVTTQTTPWMEPGAYVLTASGNADGAEWKVFTAPTEGGRCVAMEADVAGYFGAMLGTEDGRVMLGCTSSASSSAPLPPGTSAPEPDPSTAVSWIDTFQPEAVPLADGRALLVSDVPDGTTEVTLRLRGGGTKTVIPVGGYFGAALGADEVAKVLVFTTPSGPQQCRLEDELGYTCDDDRGAVVGSGSGSASSSESFPDGSGADSSSSASTTVPATTPR